MEGMLKIVFANGREQTYDGIETIDVGHVFLSAIKKDGVEFGIKSDLIASFMFVPKAI